MGSSRGNCEIVEAIDEPITIQNGYYSNRDLRPPVSKKVPNKSLEDDINKLFESVNLRTSKSLDLSDTWRNASKRPMRATGSHSPGIGFSAPVSLKQSLRGLCISQAAEIAAMKRMSLPASPRVSEVGRFSNLYRFVAAEASGSGVPQVAKSTSSSSEVSRLNHQDSISTSATESSSSPSFSFEPVIRNMECSSSESTSLQFRVSSDSKDVESSSVPEDIALVPDADTQLVQKISLQETEVVPDSEPPHNKSSASKKVECHQSENLSPYVKAANKTTPKVRKKSATSPSGIKVNKDVKSTRSTSRAVRPIVKKNLVIKKSKKVGPLTDEANKVCQKCQCSMSHVADGVSKSDPIPADDPEVKTSTPVIKSNIPSKSSDKGEISGSSNSSGFSSSTTSLSIESNPSGTIFGNRPHMSKDVRWGAIERVRKQYGFLGLSHFNLLKKLGSGDIGTVYLAELIGTNCPFAIKVMDNEFLGRRKKLPRAQTEREILRMLDHPFLPTLYAQFTSDNLSCLVMEFCPGGDLHVLRQKQPGRYFPEQAARFYVAEVLLALEYLHMLGIIYRDLKPENILVREDGHIMLTDFDLSLRCSVSPMLVKSSSLGFEPPRASGPCAGSSCIDPFCSAPSCKVSCFRPRRQHPSTKLKTLNARSLPQLVVEPTEARSNSFVGTHEYLAPEIIKGDGHGSAVDWWTFGVFLYELLYGKTPFKGSGNEETLDNAVLQSLRFPDTPIVSFQARDLIRGLLVKDPENRFGTETGAAEIKRHLFFEGLNWALIRCAVPPQIPEIHDDGSSRKVSSEEKGGKFVDNGNGEQVEFELF